MKKDTKKTAPGRSGTVTISETGVISLISDTVREICGPEADELLGQSIKHLLPSEMQKLQKHVEQLLNQKELNLQEFRHRVVNGLQLIASILMMRAREIHDEDARKQMEDAHLRIIALAQMQRLLDIHSRKNGVHIVHYLEKLCTVLEASMIHGRPITLKVSGRSNALVDNATAVALGLITTELVINALKYAFAQGSSGAIRVIYLRRGSEWTLQVIDDGIGFSETDIPGLGKKILDSLAQQLEAEITRTPTHPGSMITITHKRSVAAP